jgi:hypothetical protein
MSLKEKIAAVLDALADEREAMPVVEAELTADTSDNAIQKFAENYRELTGEAPNDELIARVQADDVLRDVLTKMSENRTQRPEPLGEATDTHSPDDESPKSKAAAIKAAEDRFAQNILALNVR